MIEPPTEIATPITSPGGDDRRTRLRELAMLFLRLGTVAFGGPAAHIAMMEDEVVRRRQWVSHEAFLDMLGACNLIPGPNSTEMAIHIGHRRAGFVGLAIAGTCFVVPAVAITIAVAWAYVHFGSMPQVAGALYGIKPVIIAVVVQALWRLWPSAARTRRLILLTLAATAAALLGLNEIAILFATGLIAIALHFVDSRAQPRHGVAVSVVATITAMPATTAVTRATALAGVAIAPFSLSTMFLLFVKIGVSGELTYLAVLSSPLRTRPLKPMTRPCSSQIGKISRPRNRS